DSCGWLMPTRASTLSVRAEEGVDCAGRECFISARCQDMRHHAPHARRLDRKRIDATRLEPEALQQILRNAQAIARARAQIGQRREVERERGFRGIDARLRPRLADE